MTTVTAPEAPVPAVPSEPVTAERMSVHLTENGDSVHLIFAQATYQWTAHGTLTVTGRRVNGYGSPCDSTTEFAPGVVTYLEVGPTV